MKNYILPFFLVGTFLTGCSKEGFIKDEYIAEKMFHHANKLYQNIMINPRIARAKDYQRAIDAFRAIVDKFYGKETSSDKIPSIYKKSWLTIAEIYLLQDDIEKAIDVYREIIDKNPGDVELCTTAQTSIALCYEKINAIDKAVNEYQDLLHSYSPVTNGPFSPNLQILQVPLHVARLYQRNQAVSSSEKMYDEAIKYYKGLANQWPQTPAAFFALNQLAASYADQKQWGKTVDILRSIIKDYPNHQNLPDILFAMGNIYLEVLRNPSESLQIYNRILNEYPNYQNLSKVHLAMGYALLGTNELEEARRKFEWVIQNYPKESETCAWGQFGIGNSYELEGKWDKAVSEYRWVVDSYPTTPPGIGVPIYIADYYKRRSEESLAHAEYEKAIKQYGQLVKKYPNTLLAALAQQYLAMAYARQEQWGKAIEALQILRSLYPSPSATISSYLMIGSIYEELRDKAKALQTYTEFMQKFPKHPLVATVERKAKKLQSELQMARAANEPPTPVKLQAPIGATQSSLLLRWTQNRDGDFASYRVFRSKSAGVDSSSTLIATITDRANVTYNDRGLEENTTYFYRVFVYDFGGLSSGSNEVVGKTTINLPPAAVTLHGQSLSWENVSLAWSESKDDDFTFYKIYRSHTSPVTNSAKLVKFISTRSITQYNDTPLSAKTTYYYKIYVYDRKGLFAASNEIKVTTPANEPPVPVVLRNPLVVDENTLRLSWTLNRDSDFSMYRIYRSESSPVEVTKAPTKIISDQLTTQFNDRGLKTGKRYFYKVLVFDRGGLSAESNEVSAIPTAKEKK